MLRHLISSIVGAWCLLAGCAGAFAQAPATRPSTSPPKLANPASQNCVAKGGTLHIERRPNGGQFGVCILNDNRQCEEWALMRGECPATGLRVTGYVTPAARYCAITGGRYMVVARSGASDEQGVCAFPDGKGCEAVAYFAGACSR